ncbi:MAG: hypothetical protein C0506_02565 [Anaerolinea sp.]|nr:hypothetical protein [Anaerolinea sp.]
MNTDRIEALLDQALVTGQIPAGATAEECAEVARLLTGAEAVRGLQSTVEEEARASQPTARARFQRHMAAQAAQPAAAGRLAREGSPRRGIVSRILGFNRGLTLAGSAAAIALVVVVATVVSQSYGGVETASALVLNDNDYAEVQGVVSGTRGEGQDRTVTVQSDFGEIEVVLTDATTTGGQTGGDVPALKRGDAVTVAGTVSKREKVTAIAAVSVAIAPERQPTPGEPKVKELRKAVAPIEGTISVLTVSSDGKAARILLDPGNGEHIVVRLAAESLGRLLASNTSPTGLRVRVSRDASNLPGEFTITVISPAQPTPKAGATRAPLTPVRGVLVSRQLNVLRVKTDRGDISVVIRPATRIVIGPGAGLTVAAVRDGETAAGHEVAIQGYIEKATGRLVAELLWVGAAVPR